MGQVRVNNRFNLSSLYVDNDYEFPFSYIDCDYYEPEWFSEKTRDLHNLNS